MTRRILIIQGHPDPRPDHYNHALAAAYAQGAKNAGHEIRILTVADVDFPLLRSKAEFDGGDIPEAIREAQEQISWAEHLVLFYPLWLGTMPALLKGFLEQVLRPGFALNPENPFGGLLKGRSARIVVTMGMPALFYRLYYRAHSLTNLKRNILRFAGFGPIRASLIGMVEGSSSKRRKWLDRMAALGVAAR